MMSAAYMLSRPRKVLFATIPLLVVAALAFLIVRPRGSSQKRASPTSPAIAITNEVQSALTQYCIQRWSGDTTPAPKSLQVPVQSIYLAARERGVLRSEGWGDGATLGGALDAAIAAQNHSARRADTLELFLVTQTRLAENGALSNIHRGIIGLDLAASASRPRVRVAPTQILASNRTHRKALGLRPSDAAPTSDLRELRGEQLLIDLAQKRSQLMVRGNTHRAFASVTQAATKKFSDGMISWMQAALDESGRMTYLYWPSQGRAAPGRNNLIRQFMASIAHGRIAAARQDPALWTRAAANIDYNLRAYYREERGLGLVEHREKVKLGAVALAALAIVEHTDRARWNAQELALRRTVDELWQPDGSFRTFYKPADRNDNQNFYPGEALLLWATLLAEAPDPALLERFMKSANYYMRWHLAKEPASRRNPAFVPWHTQAYFLVWQSTRSEFLQNAIFEMNDWLLDMQEWDEARYPDTRGRFYDAEHDYGPPHASATGVYLEGLIDAYRLAREVGDTHRSKNYAEAIVRGLRSSMQLQFEDDIDMFYVSKKSRVAGGLRTTVYDNQIRCDNVQHTLMATLKILATDLLASYRLPAIREG